MISPYVRRLRLGAELLTLRRQHHLSSQQLSHAVDLPRTTISRLENGRVRPDLSDVMKILEQMGVTGDRWTELMTIAREATERGWWESFGDEMGRRQALYANLEAGATAIVEYQMALLPGLLQITEFTEARADPDRADWSGHFTLARAVEARTMRQRMLHRPDGPSYSVIIDELAVRRAAADGEIVRRQLRHIVTLASSEPRVSIRVLPIDASIADHTIPRSGFSAYRYPDPNDPTVVAVDTVTDDLVLTHAADIAHYLDLYQRLCDAALSTTDSARLLSEAADHIPHLAGNAS
jgi:transcriptional regulator with XRE-family HTH domain